LSSGVVFYAQELKTALSAKEAEKVEVQKELHELQIRVRDISGPVGLGLHDIDHDAVQNIIEDMEAHRIGAYFCRRQTCNTFVISACVAACTVMLTGHGA